MSSVLLTDIYVSRLKAKEKQFEVFDKKVKGLTVRVSPGGTKAFGILYRFGRRNRRETFGCYPTVSLKEARQRAQEALHQVSNGIDPQGEKLRARNSHAASLFSRVASEFVENYAKRNTKSWRQTDRVLRIKFVPEWGNFQLQQISKRAINALLDDIVEKSGPSAANRDFAVIRRFFNWAVEKGHLEHSPSAGVKAPSRVVARDRVLSDAELTAILLAAKNMRFPFGPYVQLLITTAQRRSEVSGLRWTDLDIEERTWTQPPNTNKSGRSHIVPLSNLALETISLIPHVHDELVFPARGKDNPVSGYSKWKSKLDQLSGVSDWTLHDLRRTAATGMARLKAPRVPQDIIELVLNHRSKSLSGVAGIYNRYEYLDDQRDALERWSRHIENLVLKAQSSADEATTEPRNVEATPVSTASVS